MLRPRRRAWVEALGIVVVVLLAAMMISPAHEHFVDQWVVMTLALDWRGGVRVGALAVGLVLLVIALARLAERLPLSASAAMSETIPPSLVLITVGATTGVSIAALFTGGLMPPVVGMVALAVVVYFQTHGEDMSGVPKASGAQVRRALWLTRTPPRHASRRSGRPATTGAAPAARAPAASASEDCDGVRQATWALLKRAAAGDAGLSRRRAARCLARQQARAVR